MATCKPCLALAVQEAQLHTDSAGCSVCPTFIVPGGSFWGCSVNFVVHTMFEYACSGEPLPQRPTRQQGSKSFRFDAVLADQHTAEDGSQYMHFTFNRGRESGAIIDAEFLLLTGLFTCPIIFTRVSSPGRCPALETLWQPALPCLKCIPVSFAGCAYRAWADRNQGSCNTR